MTTPDGCFVARVWTAGDLLAIDRDHEHHNSVAAAAAGVGAPVLAYRPAECVLVLGYLDGRTLRNADVRRPGHACPGSPGPAGGCTPAPRFAGDFDMFAVQRRYLAVATAARVPDPGRLRRRWRPRCDGGPAGAGRARRGHRAVQQRPAGGQLHRRRPAHLADRLRVLRQQRPVLRAGQHRRRVPACPRTAWPSWSRHYYGRALRNKIARAQLLGLVGKYGWTLWGAIQQASSPIEFDFWAWAMERFESAAAGLHQPGVQLSCWTTWRPTTD